MIHWTWFLAAAIIVVAWLIALSDNKHASGGNGDYGHIFAGAIQGLCASIFIGMGFILALIVLLVHAWGWL